MQQARSQKQMRGLAPETARLGNQGNPRQAPLPRKPTPQGWAWSRAQPEKGARIPTSLEMESAGCLARMGFDGRPAALTGPNSRTPAAPSPITRSVFDHSAGP